METWTGEQAVLLQVTEAKLPGWHKRQLWPEMRQENKGGGAVLCHMLLKVGTFIICPGSGLSKWLLQRGAPLPSPADVFQLQSCLNFSSILSKGFPF